MKTERVLSSEVLPMGTLLSAGFLAQNQTTGQAHSETTRSLIELVEKHPELKGFLIQSIEKAKEANPDLVTNPVRNLEEYYSFIDWSLCAMPWDVIRKSDNPATYDNIRQSIHYFYFINDQPLEQLKGRGYYNNSLQYYEPYSSWITKYCREWGHFLSTYASWSWEFYEIVYSDPRFGLQKGWYEDASHWKSFNDFFSRRLKSPAVRPIALPGNDEVICSPADAEPQGIWEIDEDSHIVQKEGVLIKSRKFNSISALLGPGCKYADSFAGGTLTHSFLDVNDYHRYHFPVSGTIREIRLIPGNDAAGGRVVWDKDLQRYLLQCESAGWQSIETRGCVIVETESNGLVALLPIGMSQVNSVNFEKNLRVGDRVKKGDMLGYFLFGGSDFVLLFQKGYHFELTPPHVSEGKFRHLLMGEELGRLKHE